MAKPPGKLTVETFTHDEATRINIPTAEYQSVMRQEEQSPIRIAYERRNRDRREPLFGGASKVATPVEIEV